MSRHPQNVFSCCSTVLIKLKDRTELGGTQLNTDQKPCVTNDPHLGFFFSVLHDDCELEANFASTIATP